MSPVFRTVPFLVRVTLGVAATLGLLAIAWQWHPAAESAVSAATAPAAAGRGAARFVLPAPPEPTPLAWLEAAERPDVAGELAPAESQPGSLRPVAPPRRIVSDPPPKVTAATYLVLDEGSGQVLFAQHGHRRHAPASVTKIMTALLAVQLGRLDAEVISDVMGSDIPESTLVGLWPGDKLTLRDLVYGLMLHSGNDAAVMIGHVISGRDQAFVELMNRRAAGLGLRDTHFANPHGLDADNHFSSAFDLAALARYAMSYPEFATIVKAKNWRVEGPPSYGMYNGNRLLSEYEGADGVKIGFTDLGGQTMVASVTRGGRRVYLAVLGSRDRIADSKLLLDYTFASYRWP